jgi:dTMP kinase
MKIIALEGIDGVGKTTISYKLKEQLTNSINNEIFVIPDPNPNDAIGSFLRNNLQEGKKFPPEVWVLLFAASSINLQNGIEGYIKFANQDSIIILDRCVLSSYAYYWNKIDLSWMDQVHNLYKYPDITIILDLDVTEVQNRLRQRTNEVVPDVKKLNELRNNYRMATSYMTNNHKYDIQIVNVNKLDTVLDVTKNILQRLELLF